MSDIALGAIIGASGAIVGSVITGWLAYRNAKLQVEAHRHELAQQLKHHEQEARLDRLIEARKGYLIPLRDTLSKWSQYVTKSVFMLVRLKEAYKKKNSPELLKELNEFEKVSDQTAQFASELANLRGQVSDATLDNILGDFLKQQYNTGPELMRLARLFNNPESTDVNALQVAMERQESIIGELRKSLVQINKRIEALLCGDQST